MQVYRNKMTSVPYSDMTWFQCLLLFHAETDWQMVGEMFWFLCPKTWAQLNFLSHQATELQHL